GPALAAAAVAGQGRADRVAARAGRHTAPRAGGCRARQLPCRRKPGIGAPMSSLQGATSPDPDWHGLPVEEVVRRLDSDRERGLSPDEAGRRLERYGPNELPA